MGVWSAVDSAFRRTEDIPQKELTKDDSWHDSVSWRFFRRVRFPAHPSRMNEGTNTSGTRNTLWEQYLIANQTKQVTANNKSESKQHTIMKELNESPLSILRSLQDESSAEEGPDTPNTIDENEVNYILALSGFFFTYLLIVW